VVKEGRATNIKEHDNEIWGSVVLKPLGLQEKTLPWI